MIFNKKLFEDLNANEKKLIEWLEKKSSFIISHYINDNKNSISDIGAIVGFSPSFIVKTLKKMGYFGWKDFKTHMGQNKNIPKIKHKYGEYIEQSLFPSIANSIVNIDENEISKLSHKICQKDVDLYFIGEGFSYFIALDQVRRYNKIGIRSFAYNSIDYYVGSITSNSIVIFISSSAYTESIVRSNNNIKNRTCTYLVTSNIRAQGDYMHIFRGNIYDEEIISERELPRNSRIIAILILDWIFTKVINILNKKRPIKLLNSRYKE